MLIECQNSLKHSGMNVLPRFGIYDIYKIDEHSTNVITKEYGEWNPNDGILLVYEKNIWKRRSNLTGRNIR